MQRLRLAAIVPSLLLALAASASNGHDVTGRAFPEVPPLPETNGDAAQGRSQNNVVFSALVQEMTESVSTDTIDSHVLWLESYGTRRADHANAWLAAAWIAQQFRNAGADSVYMQEWTAGFAPNVVAIRRGTTTPDDIFVVGGHYDSINRYGSGAPGADDNASGTAGVLECARVLCRHRFASTLVFVAFGAEEVGLFGSNAFAADAQARAQNIVGMLNLDMIGYVELGDRRDLDVIYNLGSAWLRDIAMQTSALYVPGFAVVDGYMPEGRGSDHMSFWTHGYDAIFFFEDSESFSPFIHTEEDMMFQSYNDPRLAMLTTKSAVAFLATLAEPIEVAVEIADFRARSAAGAVDLEWRLTDAGLRRLDGIVVERAENAAGPFERRGGVLPPQAAMRFAEAGVETGRTYWYRLLLLTADGTAEPAGPIAVQVHAAGLRTALHAPFEPGDGGPVQISYSVGWALPAVRLALYDVRGRLVRSLPSAADRSGEYLQTWDRRDDRGAPVHRGVYFLRLEAGGTRASRKLVLLHD